MNILTLNAGSNSLKFEIVAIEPHAPENAFFGSSLIAGVYDNVGKKDANFAFLEGRQPRERQNIEIRDHGHATELLLKWIEEGHAASQGIANFTDIERVGHRVVHGADEFRGPAQINDDVVQRIESLEDLAPLHNKSSLAVIRAAQKRFGSQTPMFAVFDTVFHQTIPDEAALYPLPLDLARKHRIRRYGFHGISHRYMMLRYAQIRKRPVHQLNLVTLHLEGGSSAAAIRGGKSVDTSMGFTPLEGLMMGTRCGDIDPAIVTYLMRKENLNADRVETLLNKDCGLMGMSGISPDTRELVARLPDEHANTALSVFAYRVRKYIGAYLAALGEAEAVVMGGGIAENTGLVRERIVAGFDWFGAVLDRQRNYNLIDSEGAITTPESSLQVWVIPTQEGRMIAREVADAAVTDK